MEANNFDIPYAIIKVISVLLKKKIFIISTTTLVALGVVLYSIGSLLLPPEKSYYPNFYSLQSIILINEAEKVNLLGSISGSGNGLSEIAGMSIAGAQSFGDLASYLLKTNSFLDALGDTLNLSDKYNIKDFKKTTLRNILKDNFSSNYDKKTSTFVIKYTDSNPILAKEILDTAVSVLIKKFETIYLQRSKLKLEHLELKLKEIKIEVIRLEDEIRKIQKKYGILSMESLSSEQINITSRIRSELLMKEIEIKTYSSVADSDHPAMKKLLLEKENLIKLIEEMENGYSEYEKVIPTQREILEFSIDFENRKRELMVQLKLYEYFEQQYQITKLSQPNETTAFQVLENAEVPDVKSGPSRGKLCIVVSILGFSFSCILVLIHEFLIQSSFFKKIGLNLFSDS